MIKTLICRPPNEEESSTALYGDTSGRLSGHQKGGDQNLTLDALIGGSAYGDANQMSGDAYGGGDTLTGGFNAINNLFGDANYMNGNASGGDDTLIGGSSATYYWYGRR
jgi:hypothetical protein